MDSHLSDNLRARWITPVVPGDDAPNLLPTRAPSLGHSFRCSPFAKIGLAFVLVLYLTNLIQREFEILPFNVGSPAFSAAVSEIFLLGPQKQVPWIAARRIVAPMADHETIWNLTMGDSPSDAMSEGRAMSARAPQGVKYSVLPLSLQGGSSPRPTILGLRGSYFRPEFGDHVRWDKYRVRLHSETVTALPI